MHSLKINHEDRDAISLRNIGTYVQSFVNADGEMTYSTAYPDVFKAWCEALTEANIPFEVLSK